MKKIAIITTDIPSKTGSGYKMRCYYIARALSKSFAVDIFSLSDNDQNKATNLDFVNHIEICNYHPIEENKLIWFINRLIRLLFFSKPAGAVRTYNNNFIDKIVSAHKNNKYDIVLAEGIWMSQYFNFFSGTKKVIDNHNIETVLYKRELKILLGFKKIVKWIDWLFKLSVFEKIKNQESDLSIVTSNNDKSFLEKMIGQDRNIKVIENVVDFSSSDKKYINPISKDYILFAGLLSYFPNEDGILWFGNKIWPKLKGNFQDLSLVIVGANPTAKIKKIFANDKNVVITGFVDNIDEYRQNALIEIVPLRLGGGTRFKILEALAFGIPVVSTSIGAEGLDIKEGEIFIEDEPESFFRAIEQLMNNKGLREEMSFKGLKVIKNKYNFDSISLETNDIFKELSND